MLRGTFVRPSLTEVAAKTYAPLRLEQRPGRLREVRRRLKPNHLTAAVPSKVTFGRYGCGKHEVAYHRPKVLVKGFVPSFRFQFRPR